MPIGARLTAWSAALRVPLLPADLFSPFGSPRFLLAPAFDAFLRELLVVAALLVFQRGVVGGVAGGRDGYRGRLTT